MDRASPLPYESRNARVLLVDDTPANLTALVAVLEPLGCDVVQARSGTEALREILRTEFAVVLLDIMMPELDGFETARLIKSRAATRELPIIFLTAYSADRGRLLEAYARGGADVLTKPLDPEIVRAKVSVFLDLFLKQRQVEQQALIIGQKRQEALQAHDRYESERDARAQAEAIAAAREQMLAVVAHDLRNPMGAISASLDMVAQETGSFAVAESVQKHVARAKRCLHSMNRLVSDLLDASRVESGHGISIVPAAAESATLIRDSVDLLAPTISQKRQAVAVSTAECRVTVDRDRLLQVLSNLIGNAVKFTPEHGRIEVTSECKDDLLHIVVEDSGPGVPPEERELIFQPFRQVRAHADGVGLGLAIARGIVEAHGGRIWVEPAEAKGSRFCLTLPRNA
jgi:signal transduction histidine kinase